ASHNAFQDNGIKFFSPTGFKLADELEAEIERLVLSDSIDALRPTATEIGKAFRIDDAVGRYNVFAKSAFPRYLTLDGLTIAVDCGHGAAYKVAPEVLEELGARVIALGVDPDGENINRDCGALHPEALQDAVRRHGAHVGVALDGDRAWSRRWCAAATTWAVSSPATSCSSTTTRPATASSRASPCWPFWWRRAGRSPSSGASWAASPRCC